MVRSVDGDDEIVPTVRIGDRFMSTPSFGQVRAAVRG